MVVIARDIALIGRFLGRGNFFIILKSTDLGDLLLLFWGLPIAISVFCLDFTSSMTIFFPLISFSDHVFFPKHNLILFNKCLCTLVDVLAKANPLGFFVLSHLISSKWLIFRRYVVVFKPKREYRSSSVTSLLRFPMSSLILLFDAAEAFVLIMLVVATHFDAS